MSIAIDSSRPPGPSASPTLERVQELYDQGLYLQAWQAARPLGQVMDWPGVRGRVLASRLCPQLGGDRLGAWLSRCAYRDYPQHPEAIYFFGYARLRSRGPYFAWRWWSDQPRIAAPAELQSSWLALGSEITAALRDFETAEGLLHEAFQIDPQNPWLHVVKAGLLQAQDRYDEALAVGREALELRPWYRPAVQTVGYLLSLRDDDSEALGFLSAASEKIESGAVSATLFSLQRETKQYAEAALTLDRVELLMPLADKRAKQWLSAQRSEIAYHFGQFDECIRFAQSSGSEFQKAIAERLKDQANRSASVVTLPVGFVRQHHKTCGPATLAAITRYWHAPADQLEVAEEICYDGTSNYSERKWAAQHGWICREFSVTEEGTRALIDRGIPFTFTTVDPGSGHLQAVIGYDARRGTLLIRDPYWRTSAEGLADKVLTRYRRFGPRGLALVPPGDADKFKDIELADAQLWDLLFELDGALEKHRREEAGTAAERLEELAPQHRLAIEGRRRLAIYDGNVAAHLAAVELLLQQFPECGVTQLERLSLLPGQVRREDRLAICREMCGKKETHPIFWQRYALELRDDITQREEALRLLRRAIRRWPEDGKGYHLLANVYWDMRRLSEALELYRFALCLNDKEEQLAMSYFSAARWLKQEESVLALLRDRFQRWGRKSGSPAQTLASALFRLDRDEEALQVIEDAIKLRPDDGQLLLYAADAQLQAGAHRTDRTHELLQLASEKAPRTEWLWSAARLADQEGRLPDALALWRELSALQPLNVAAQQAIVRLISATEGRETATNHLRRAVEQLPHNLPLFEIWVEWLRDEPNTAREPILRSGLEQFPNNAWLHRELAFLLLSEGRHDEARRHSLAAYQLDPLDPAWHYLEADLLHHEGKHAEGQAMFRKVLELSVDNDYGISRLMEGCKTLAERREAVAFIKEQLVKQVIFGDGLLAFREHAYGTLEGEELLKVLREALDQRPDLWHAWSACIQELLALNRQAEAWELCQQANQRFPLVPRLWLERSRVARARLDSPGEEEALEAALKINPAWNEAVRGLADLFQRQRRFAEEEQILRRAAARNPLDPVLQQLLAEALWRLERREEAVSFALRAVRIEPGYDRVWDVLHAWGAELDQPELALTVARELTQQRSGEARSWLILTRLLDRDEQRDERFAALDRALALNARCTDAYDQKAMLLAREQKWNEALEACNAPIWQGHPPNELRARAAWIEAERGQGAAAVKLMEAVVRDDPNFYGAWSKLADWYHVLGDKDGYMRAAEALVRLSPHYEVSLGYLGEARFIKGDKRGAREALERAFELNPRYEFAGNLLYDMHFEAEEYDQAAAWSARVREHSESSEAYARQAQIAGVRRQAEPVLDALSKIIADPNANPWVLATVMDAIQAANCGLRAEHVLKEAFSKEKVHPSASEMWVKLRIARGFWPTLDELRALLPLQDIGEQAFYAYIEAIERHGDTRRLLALAQEDAGWLRGPTFYWACVGRGLVTFGHFELARRWMSDWQNRQDVKPWMLLNVVEALRAVGNASEAVICSLRALELSERHAQQFHHLFLACDDSLEGRFNEARAHLQRFAEINGAGEVDPAFQLLQTAAAAVVEMADAEPPQRKALFPLLRQRMKQARKSCPAFERELVRKRIYRASLMELAKLRGGLVGRLWGWWFEMN